MESGMNEGDDGRAGFRGLSQKDPLQFYNVIMVILGWSAIAALSAYIILS